MLFNTVFIATLLAVVLAQGLPQPTCYQSSTGFGPASACDQFIDIFCNDAGLALTPVRIGDSTSRCFRLPDNNRCDFIAFNTYTQFVPPSIVNCKNVLRNVIAKCNQGGSGSVSDTAYTFTVDPNRGPCGSDVQAGS